MQKSEALVGTSTNDDRRHRRRDDGRIASGGWAAHDERREGATTDAGGRASIAAAAEEEERRRPPPPPPPPPAGGADGDVVVVGGDSVISGGVDSSTSSGIISSPAVVATGMPLLPPSSSSSAYDDDPHHRRRHRPRPFFYYRNDTAASSDASRSSSHPRYFALHPHRDYGSTTPYHYDYYGTTLSIIFLLHLVYFHQWNARRARRDVCTSYDQLVGRKQYYRAVLAFASHPPSAAAEGEGGASEFVGDAASSGDDYSAPSEGTRSSPSSSSASSSPGPRGRLLCGMIPPAAFFRATLPLRGRGSLSGLPLLAYASHVLWQCRALEELYDSYDGSIVLGVTGGDAGGSSGPAPLAGIGTSQIAVEDLDLLPPRRAGDVYDDDDGHHRPPSWSEGGCSSYLRVLSALALTSLLLELSLIRYVLRRVDGIANFDGYRTTPRQLLSHRAMCSIASLSTAVLGVYDSHFPYTPPPVLPFVGNVPFLSSSSSGGFVSRLLSILLLMGLSRGIHPITSVVSGMWSGYLWSWGLTSFLGTRYWGNVTLLVSAMAILLSLKAQPSHSACMKLLFPCIDYVGWDEVGDIIANNGRGGGTTPRRRNGNDGDLEDGGGHHPGEDGAIPPLLSSSRSSLSDRGIRSAIRGRVPRMDSNDSDDFLDGAEDLVVNNEETMPLAAPSRFGALHSRRGSGIQSD